MASYCRRPAKLQWLQVSTWLLYKIIIKFSWECQMQLQLAPVHMTTPWQGVNRLSSIARGQNLPCWSVMVRNLSFETHVFDDCIIKSLQQPTSYPGESQVSICVTACPDRMITTLWYLRWSPRRRCALRWNSCSLVVSDVAINSSDSSLEMASCFKVGALLRSSDKEKFWNSKRSKTSTLLMNDEANGVNHSSALHCRSIRLGGS